MASQGLLVPQRGVTRNQRGEPTAMVVNAENKVELRTLKTDRAVGDQWLVSSGLAAGDKVIVEGLQMVRPGVEVVATEAGAKPQGSAAASGRRREEAVSQGATHGKVFIDRPVFAWVIAIVLMMAGALSILKLPVSQYPNIAPPAIGIAVTYPGASAQTVQDTVVQVIEQQMNGLDGLEYISSESNSDGSMSITLTFRQGTNPDTAQVQVQNKLSLAQPLLPQEVQQQGIRVTKATKNFLIVAGFVSTDGTMTKDDLADYVASYVQDPISRTQGVGDFQLFGSQYAMRIWLNPDKLINYGLTTTDVVNAIKEQNVRCRPASWAACRRARPAAQRHHHRTVAPAEAGRLRPHPAEGQSGRLAGARPTWPASSWAARPTPSTATSTASRPRAWRSSWRRAPMRWTRRRRCATPSTA